MSPTWRFGIFIVGMPGGAVSSYLYGPALKIRGRIITMYPHNRRQ